MPRFQFRLRTLLIVVTLAAVGSWYVVGQWQLVQARANFLRDHTSIWWALFNPGPPRYEISWLRRLMGDKTISSIDVQEWATDDEVKAAKRLFDEAQFFDSRRPDRLRR
jgi:hypothetical protein